MKRSRQQQILSILEHQPSIRVNTLSETLGVSCETIRRDLRELQELGQLIRRHGEARRVKQNQEDLGLPFMERIKTRSFDKESIAEQALGFIQPKMVIALDASSTCWLLAKKLPNIDLTVFTNSLSVFKELEKKSNIRIISSGGLFSHKYTAFFEDASLLLFIKNLAIDLFFFSCDGIDKEGVLWDSNTRNAEFKSLLNDKVEQSVLLVDKSKFNRKGTASICHINQVDSVISNGFFDTINNQQHLVISCHSH